MTEPTFSSFVAHLQRLDRALGELAAAAATIGVPSPAGEEWFELLRKKLLPQAELPPTLVVAVVGGTNIGKSAIFNCLAGQRASAVSPLAAGTKHPVCLVPPEAAEPELLAQLFPSFTLHAWRSADEALEDSPENRLFWRQGNGMPPRLLLLDAPDVDSDAAVNWERARAIRQSADVLLAVLTQQKYNDAAVKQFFRAAVDADKPIVVLFNQVDLNADRAFWPIWLQTFSAATGANPELVYVIPHDRAAADELRLPFYRVPGSGPGTGSGPFFGQETSPLRDDPARKHRPDPFSRGDALTTADPRADLGQLHFDAIKIRTFRGALRRALDAERGLPGYLRRVRMAAGDFAAAAKALEASELARVTWPALPAGVLVDEIRDWWDAGRANWSRQIHGFYRTVIGRGVLWPVRKAWQQFAGPTTDPLEAFQRRERDAILQAVEKLFDELQRLAEVGNETLRPRLLRLLGGNARAVLLDRVQTAHAALPAVDEDYRKFLRTELDAWRAGNPRVVKFLQSLDHAAAVARPAITVVLFFTGLHVAGDLVGQAAAQAAGHTAGHLATEAAIAGGLTGGGEALVSSTSEGVSQAAGRLFLRLQNRYALQRAGWLASWLEQELLGDLLHELRRGADIPATAPFAEVASAAAALEID